MATTTRKTLTSTFWADTREEGEAKAAAMSHQSGYPKVEVRITPTDKPNYMVEVVYDASGPDGCFHGKAGYVEFVEGLRQGEMGDGDPVYNVWTDDGHVGGAFSTAAQARAWAKKEGVRVREGVVRTKAPAELTAGRRGQVNPKFPG